MGIKSILIHFFLFTVLIFGCSKNPEKLISSEEKRDNSIDSGKTLNINYSDFLGHFFLETNEHLNQSIHYDVRFGNSSLLIKKCSDFGICELPGEFHLISKSGNGYIFQPKDASGDKILTFTFSDDHLFVFDYDSLDKEWMRKTYISDR
ncbi:MAG: hypothetical protein AAF843_13800 [Bacteroidota bacterium]